jgi:hypothetical protein
MTTCRTELPTRVQLRRAKGWRMPENTVKVDRSTRWGNPFVVGKHGTQARCVELFTMLLGGYQCISMGADIVQAQLAYIQHAQKHLAELRGKSLACWCRLGTPCHADVLLAAANGRTVDVELPRLVA